jgi:hypothetical protein
VRATTPHYEGNKDREGLLIHDDTTNNLGKTTTAGVEGEMWNLKKDEKENFNKHHQWMINLKETLRATWSPKCKLAVIRTEVFL